MHTSLLDRLRLHGYVHLTADEVHARAVEFLPEVSRATTSSHNHLVCGSCGVIHDVQHGLPPLQLPLSEAHGMAVRRAEIVYHATCESCLAS